MKPSAVVTVAKRLSRYDNEARPSSLLTAVRCEFQTRRGGGQFPYDGGDPNPRPNFNSLTREVLRADASRTFVLETAVLGLVAIVSLWPVAIMIREVARLLLR